MSWLGTVMYLMHAGTYQQATQPRPKTDPDVRVAKIGQEMKNEEGDRQIKYSDQLDFRTVIQGKYAHNQRSQQRTGKNCPQIVNRMESGGSNWRQVLRAMMDLMKRS